VANVVTSWETVSLPKRGLPLWIRYFCLVSLGCSASFGLLTNCNAYLCAQSRRRTIRELRYFVSTVTCVLQHVITCFQVTPLANPARHTDFVTKLTSLTRCDQFVTLSAFCFGSTGFENWSTDRVYWQAVLWVWPFLIGKYRNRVFQREPSIPSTALPFQSVSSPPTLSGSTSAGRTESWTDQTNHVTISHPLKS
jgi:hypothetical protein